MSQALATLYGLKRVERASAFLLAAGALTGVDVAALRSQVHNGFSHSSSLDPLSSSVIRWLTCFQLAFRSVDPGLMSQSVAQHVSERA